MINALHILWIVPLVSAFSFMLAAVFSAGHEGEEPRRGRWEQSEVYHGFCTCSQCHDCYVEPGWIKMKKWNYCPTCGAKMEEV